MDPAHGVALTTTPGHPAIAPLVYGGELWGEHGRHRTTPVTFQVSNARPVHARDLFALVDVEVLVGGVALISSRIQVRREPGDRTSVRLPTFKDADSIWRPAIRLPDEVRAPLADAVLTFLMEEGLAKRRFESHPCAGEGRISDHILREALTPDLSRLARLPECLDLCTALPRHVAS